MAEIVSRARAHAEDDIKAHKENQAAELGLNYRFWQREFAKIKAGDQSSGESEDCARSSHTQPPRIQSSAGASSRDCADEVDRGKGECTINGIGEGCKVQKEPE